jgi:ubiquitin carboxyl-terminal hydrolase 7
VNRRILFFPYGNHAEHASFYLEHAWEGEPPEGWYACVQFALVLSNVNDPSIYVHHGKIFENWKNWATSLIQT